MRAKLAQGNSESEPGQDAAAAKKISKAFTPLIPKAVNLAGGRANAGKPLPKVSPASTLEAKDDPSPLKDIVCYNVVWLVMLFETCKQHDTG